MIKYNVLFINKDTEQQMLLENITQIEYITLLHSDNIQVLSYIPHY